MPEDKSKPVRDVIVSSPNELPKMLFLFSANIPDPKDSDSIGIGVMLNYEYLEFAKINPLAKQVLYNAVDRVKAAIDHGLTERKSDA